MLRNVFFFRFFSPCTFFLLCLCRREHGRVREREREGERLETLENKADFYERKRQIRQQGEGNRQIESRRKSGWTRGGSDEC